MVYGLGFGLFARLTLALVSRAASISATVSWSLISFVAEARLAPDCSTEAGAGDRRQAASAARSMWVIFSGAADVRLDVVLAWEGLLCAACGEDSADLGLCGG